jgi:hypothetical protein
MSGIKRKIANFALRDCFRKFVVMNELIFLVEEADEGGYVARALGESIFTQADNLVELKEMIKDAVRCHFDLEHLPKMIRLHFVKEEVFAV